MTPETQELLGRTLQHLRDVRARRDQHQDLAFAHAEGVFAGLEAIRAIDATEARLWRGRIAEILAGPNPPRRRPRRDRVDPPPVVRRVVAGSVLPEPFFDGWIRVVAVEVLDTGVRVHWNISPMPGYEAVLGDDLARLDRDTEGLADAEREHARQHARSMRLFRTKQFKLSDDAGTAYRFARGHSTEKPDTSEQTGIAHFLPAPPEYASSLDVSVEGTHISVPLTRG